MANDFSCLNLLDDLFQDGVAKGSHGIDALADGVEDYITTTTAGKLDVDALKAFVDKADNSMEFQSPRTKLTVARARGYVAVAKGETTVSKAWEDVSTLWASTKTGAIPGGQKYFDALAIHDVSKLNKLSGLKAAKAGTVPTPTPAVLTQPGVAAKTVVPIHFPDADYDKWSNPQLYQLFAQHPDAPGGPAWRFLSTDQLRQAVKDATDPVKLTANAHLAAQRWVEKMTQRVANATEKGDPKALAAATKQLGESKAWLKEFEADYLPTGDAVPTVLPKPFILPDGVDYASWTKDKLYQLFAQNKDIPLVEAWHILTKPQLLEVVKDASDPVKLLAHARFAVDNNITKMQERLAKATSKGDTKAMLAAQKLLDKAKKQKADFEAVYGPGPTATEAKAAAKVAKAIPEPVTPPVPAPTPPPVPAPPPTPPPLAAPAAGVATPDPWVKEILDKAKDQFPNGVHPHFVNQDMQVVLLAPGAPPSQGTLLVKLYVDGGYLGKKAKLAGVNPVSLTSGGTNVGVNITQELLDSLPQKALANLKTTLSPVKAAASPVVVTSDATVQSVLTKLADQFIHGKPPPHFYVPSTGTIYPLPFSMVGKNGDDLLNAYKEINKNGMVPSVGSVADLSDVPGRIIPVNVPDDFLKQKLHPKALAKVQLPEGSAVKGIQDAFINEAAENAAKAAKAAILYRACSLGRGG